MLRFAFAVLSAFLLPVLLATDAGAQPQIPAVLFGVATVDGAPVPDGTPVRAFIDGLDCTAESPLPRTLTRAGVSVYVIHVVHESQRPGCGVEGDTVTFTVDGRAVPQSASWAPTLIERNLNAGLGDPVELPATLFTPVAEEPGVASTPTLRPTVPPEVLPTDDPNVIPGTDVGVIAVRESDDGSDLIGPVLAVLGLLAALGSLAGVLLARRR